MNILFGNPNIEADRTIMIQIKAIIDSGWVSIGEYVEALEDHFKKQTGVKHAIAVSSATQGLVIAIKAAGWASRVVHIPAFTWPSTLYAVNCSQNLGAICQDIDKETWLMTEDIVKVSENDCVIPVDTFGQTAGCYTAFSFENKIYDAAHGYGLDELGHRGIAEVVSLSFTKVVTSMEGGMILTNDDKLAETAVELRRLTARMGEINALMGLRSVDIYDRKLCMHVINYYKKHITVPYKCQSTINDTNNSVFAIMFKDTQTRDAIRIALEKAGCETKVYYDPLFEGLPNTQHVYSRILALPIHVEVPKHQDEIIEIINTAGRRARTPGKEFLTR